VRDGGHGDADGIDAIDNGPRVGERLGPNARGHGSRALGLDVHHADQLHAGRGRQQPRMVLPDMPDADHGNS